MRTPTEVLDSLEEAARASLNVERFISGTLRLDAEYLPDLGRMSWRINGVVDDREQCAHAIERARAQQGHPFSYHHAT